MANTKKASSIPAWRSIKSWRKKLNYPAKKAPALGALKNAKYPCKKCDFVGTKPGQLGGHQKVHRSKAQLRKEAMGGVRALRAKLGKDSPKAALRGAVKALVNKYGPPLSSYSRKPIVFTRENIEMYLSASQKHKLANFFHGGFSSEVTAKRLRIRPAKVAAYFARLSEKAAAPTPRSAWTTPIVDKTAANLAKLALRDAETTSGSDLEEKTLILSAGESSKRARLHIESLIREHEYKVGQLKSVLSML